MKGRDRREEKVGEGRGGRGENTSLASLARLLAKKIVTLLRFKFTTLF